MNGVVSLGVVQATLLTTTTSWRGRGGVVRVLVLMDDVGRFRGAASCERQVSKYSAGGWGCDRGGSRQTIGRARSPSEDGKGIIIVKWVALLRYRPTPRPERERGTVRRYSPRAGFGRTHEKPLNSCWSREDSCVCTGVSVGCSFVNSSSKLLVSAVPFYEDSHQPVPGKTDAGDAYDGWAVGWRDTLVHDIVEVDVLEERVSFDLFRVTLAGAESP